MKGCIKFFIAILSTATIFTSCYTDGGMFSTIRKEVPLEEATVPGIVNSIVRYQADNGQEFLVVAANHIYYKLADKTREENPWTEYTNEFAPCKPGKFNYQDNSFSGYSIIKVAADSKYIYALTVTYDLDREEGENLPKTMNIYYKAFEVKSDSTESAPIFKETTEDWAKIDIDLSEKIGKTTIFCTNAVKNENRKAYLRIGNGEEQLVYSLEGGTATEISVTATDTTDKKADINSAVIYNGSEYFFSTPASVTNETTEADATRLYYSVKEEKEKSETYTIFYNKTSADTDFESCGLSNPYPFLALTATNNSLIIGRGTHTTYVVTDGGLIKLDLNEGVPGKEPSKFTTNADSALTTYYTILSLLTVDPSKNEEDGILYASVNFKGSGSSNPVSYENIGLWSYNPTRGNWNRE